MIQFIYLHMIGLYIVTITLYKCLLIPFTNVMSKVHCDETFRLDENKIWKTVSLSRKEFRSIAHAHHQHIIHKKIPISPKFMVHVSSTK